MGIELDGVAKAYPLDLLRQKKAFTDTLAGRKLAFTFDPATDQLTVRDEAGNEVPFVTVYWFVWRGMDPDTGGSYLN